MFAKIKYPIKYELNGGTNNIDNPSEYTIDDYIKIKDPTKENHTFLGWEEGDEIPLGSTGTKHFTAKWKKIEESLPHGNSSIPQTGDNIMISVFMLLISLAGLFGGILYIKRKNNR